MSDRTLDALVAVTENGPPKGQARWTRPHLMKVEHDWLVERGLLSPDEPTPWTHHLADTDKQEEGS